MHGWRLQKTGAQRIGHDHVASAHGLHQTWYAQGGVAAQFEGVAVVVVQPAQQAVNGLQPLHCLEVKALVAHGQVAAFDQRQAQITGQVGVLEIGFVVRAGGQQGQTRRLAIGARLGQGLQSL